MPAFERHFGLSATVLQRYAVRAQRLEEWRAEHPEPDDDAPAAEKRAWAEAAQAFADELRDDAPPQEHMLFMAWLRARKVDPAAVPGDFDAFLDEVMRLEYTDPDLEGQVEAPASNGHAVPPEEPVGFDMDEPAGDPTAPVAPSSS